MLSDEMGRLPTECALCTDISGFTLQVSAFRLLFSSLRLCGAVLLAGMSAKFPL
jgi:hypothetical protein